MWRCTQRLVTFERDRGKHHIWFFNFYSKKYYSKLLIRAFLMKRFFGFYVSQVKFHVAYKNVCGNQSLWLIIFKAQMPTSFVYFECSTRENSENPRFSSNAESLREKSREINFHFPLSSVHFVHSRWLKRFKPARDIFV